MIKSISPNTKIVSTVLTVSDGLPVFEELLTNTTLSLDAVGVVFYPVYFGWRLNKLREFAELYGSVTTSKDFWISEIGMETLNFGEDAQAKFIAKMLSLASNPNEFNVSGIAIHSLKDNWGYTLDRGLVSHFGLVYYNDGKKKAFDAVSYAFGKIISVL
ncbi:MAG: hypothetical protein FK734_14265 [Asgard group archaeon]|nr:hypothetical protein [Asgard group archaeon]